MAVRFAGAADTAAFWELIRSGTDASSRVPSGRWPVAPELLIDDDAVHKVDRVPHDRGFFIADQKLDGKDLFLNSEELARIQQLDPLYRLAIEVGRDAVNDCSGKPLNRSRTGIVVGNIVLPTEGSSKLAESTLGATFRELALGQPPEAAEILGEDAFAPALVAGYLAKSLGCGAGSYTIDAACASSLYSIKLAADALINGVADAMIAGGLCRPDSLYTQMGFNQLQALSPTGRCFPFDQRASGLVVGEGAGLFVLKRVEDAVRDGDHIYGIIAGCGLSNDVGGSLLAPSSEGQLRAMRAAYTSAGWQPSDVDVIECHATGTPLGDKVEIESLKQLWRQNKGLQNRCVLGSVKANVGHLLTAAGASSLAKILLCLQHKSIAPTANFEQSSQSLHLENSPFRVLTTEQNWNQRDPSTPRRAAISGFGFGGINAHLLVEEWIPGQKQTGSISPAAVVAKEEALVAIIGIAQEKGQTSAVPNLENWSGAATCSWYQDLFKGAPEVQRYPISEVSVALGQFRIPPNEIKEISGQQLLMLNVADAARKAAGMPATNNLQTGVYIGIGQDSMASQFTSRWQLANTFQNKELEDIRNKMLPPLTAGRTLGCLGGIVASRIAREFGCGGPSFTISNEEASGLRAMQLAVNAIANGEISTAVVGAVDLPNQLLATVASRSVYQEHIGNITDAAVAFVLKDVEAAKRDGDLVLAYVSRSEFSTGDYVPMASGSYAGAATGLLALADSVETMRLRLVTGTSDYWFQNRDAGPRTSTVTTTSLDRVHAAVTIHDASPNNQARSGIGHTDWSLIPFAGITHSEVLVQIVAFEHDCLETLTRDRPDFVRRQAKLLADQYGSAGAGPIRAAIVLDHGRAGNISDQIATLKTAVNRLADSNIRSDGPVVFCGTAQPGQRTAFVYPGAGSCYASLGRQLYAAFPDVLEAHHLETGNMADQVAVEQLWHNFSANIDSASSMGAQCAYGSVVTDILVALGIKPDAAIGYSLGESTALVALRVWQDRTAMYQRLQNLALFKTDLCGAMTAVRQHWQLGEGEPVTWITAIVMRSEADVRAALEEFPRVYLHNVHGSSECVVGGDRMQVVMLCSVLKQALITIPTLPALHCPVVNEVAEAFKAFHTMVVRQPEGIDFYSGAGAKIITDFSTQTVCDSIFEHAVYGIDVPKLIRQAYADGIRTFIEVGPGNTMSRLIRGTLDIHNDVNTISLATSVDGELGSVYRAAAKAWTLGTELNFSFLNSRNGVTPVKNPTKVAAKTIVVPIGGIAFEPILLPAPPQIAETPEYARIEPQYHRSEPIYQSLQPMIDLYRKDYLPVSQNTSSISLEIAKTEEMNLRVQALYNEQAHSALVNMGNLLATHLDYTPVYSDADSLYSQPSDAPVLTPEAQPTAVKPWLDFAMCQEYARGSIANVLGPDFAEIDTFPTRVRLPDGPLMLCHRIMSVEGVPKSLGSGTLVTEHDVTADSWYLDDGRIPTCVAVEAGQADLFLSGYLGIDFHTKGLASYRLLDAVVTFHDRLPIPGDTIIYVIKIYEFFSQADTKLFRFSFEATVNGQKLITMEKGCAGFFTQEELDLGRGIVRTTLDLQQRQGKLTGDFVWPLPMAKESFSFEAVEALRRGAYAEAFGPMFAGLAISQPKKLPGGMLNLVHRIPALEPLGGRWGLGLIRGEADIRPDDWFLTCHFVDDMVMPGTLMYECCQHTLRVYLMRMGWVGETDDMPCEPIPGVASQLICRGQVLATSRTVTYEIEIKELGYAPDAYALADALMYVDGRPIVEIRNLSVRHLGFTKDKVDAIWQNQSPAQAAIGAVPEYNYEKILAFSQGNPSEAFGEPYKIFDGDSRRIARLPRPPFQFLDRIVKTNAEPWKMVAGGNIVAEFDVQPDAWYFEPSGAPARMPFAVLLEAALQPCGWFSAFMGSALRSDEDLKYRNLGGSAILHEVITPDIGVLKTVVHATKVAQSGPMIIQNFDFAMTANGRPIYTGTTVFGFFSIESLSNQVGLRGATVPVFPQLSQALPFPEKAHLPRAPWRMIDNIVAKSGTGGKSGLGYIQGNKLVNADEWFFQAHFYQDPVMPGSLGVECFQQLLTLQAEDRWPQSAGSFFEPIAVGVEHHWVYRGQVIPTQGKVDIYVEITSVDDTNQGLTADGFLTIDGKPIYELKNFSVEVATRQG